MGKIPNELNKTAYWVIGLSSIALVIVVMLVLFGNLYRNLGFSQDTSTITNETIVLSAAGNVPASVSGKLHGTLASVIVTNATSGEVLPATNYSVTALTIAAVGTLYTDQNVNVSAKATYDSSATADSDNVILNYTTSSVNTAKQFTVIGTILGISVLLVVLIGILIFAVKRLTGTGMTGGSNSSFRSKFRGSHDSGFA